MYNSIKLSLYSNNKNPTAEIVPCLAVYHFCCPERTLLEKIYEHNDRTGTTVLLISLQPYY